jgi:hypothetical protein
MTDEITAFGASTAEAVSLRIAAVRAGDRGAIATAQATLDAPHDEHRTRASNGDVAVAWLAVLPLGTALLLTLVN